MIIHLVYKNSDMTEGRGPMVLDKAFITRQLAVDYANSQKGVMGTSPFRDHTRARELAPEQYKSKWDDPVCGGWFCKACHPSGGGTWQIREMEVGMEPGVGTTAPTQKRRLPSHLMPDSEVGQYRAMADRLQGEVDRLIGVIELEAASKALLEIKMARLQFRIKLATEYLDNCNSDPAHVAAGMLRQE